jgi:hypothetical protein
MSWTVEVNRRMQRQIVALPLRVQQSLVALLRDIETAGPVRGNWPNYSTLGRGRHHRHLKKGRPTYVAVWEVIDRERRIIDGLLTAFEKMDIRSAHA